MPPASNTTIGGEEFEHIIAEKTVIVKDEVIGIDRQVTAGERVPVDLIEPYKKKVAGGKPAAKAAAEKPAE